jgi:hypothetical protein
MYYIGFWLNFVNNLNQVEIEYFANSIIESIWEC